MTEVYASKGPLAGRRVDIPDEDVAAATAPDGWAIKVEAGANLTIDASAPYNPAWKIPGYVQGGNDKGEAEQLPAGEGGNQAGSGETGTAEQQPAPAPEAAPKDTKASGGE